MLLLWSCFPCRMCLISAESGHVLQRENPGTNTLETTGEVLRGEPAQPPAAPASSLQHLGRHRAVLILLFVVCVDFDMVSEMLLKDLDLSRVSSMVQLEPNPLVVLFFLPFPSQVIDHSMHKCVFHGSCIIKYFIL